MLVILGDLACMFTTGNKVGSLNKISLKIRLATDIIVNPTPYRLVTNGMEVVSLGNLRDSIALVFFELIVRLRKRVLITIDVYWKHIVLQVIVIK